MDFELKLDAGMEKVVGGGDVRIIASIA